MNDLGLLYGSSSTSQFSLIAARSLDDMKQLGEN